MWRGNCAQRGMVSLLFVLALLPVLLVMVAVTLEFSHLVGVRDHIQRALDDEAFEALAYRRLATEVETRVRKRLTDRSRVSFSMVGLRAVKVATNQSSAEVYANLDYTGTFLSFIENIVGKKSHVVELSAESRARRQRAGVLLLLDRTVVPGVDPCTAQEFDARAMFVDSVVETLRASSDTAVKVAVFPGARGITELLTTDIRDGVERCRPHNDELVYDVRGVAARSATRIDPFEMSLEFAQVVSDELLANPFEYRAVVIVLSAEAYPDGYSAFVQQALGAASEGVGLPLRVLTVVAGVDRTFVPLPPTYGMHGGSTREIAASLAELRQGRLAGAVSRTLSERIVWEK